MATKLKQDRFALVMIVLVVLAAAMLFYSENPFLFSSSNKQSATGAAVSLYVLPQKEHVAGSESTSESGMGI